MYIDISNQWGKRPSVLDGALFVELLFLKTLFCPFKWKCLVGNFSLVKEAVLKRERVREGDPECERPDRLKTARESEREEKHPGPRWPFQSLGLSSGV